MHVLVTGASGFIGRALIRELAAAGHTGIAVSRSAMSALPLGWSHVCRGAMLETTPAFSALTAVIHLEVKQHVPCPAEPDMREFREVNVLGTQQWLDWCSSHKISRFLYFSSVKALDVSAEIPYVRWARHPQQAYGASKLAAEGRVTQWVGADPDRSAVILRPAVVYGPGNRGNIGLMVNAIARNRFCLVGDNCNIKSMVSIRNLTAATTHALQGMPPGVCTIYTVVDGQSYSVRELDAKIRHLLGKKGQSITLPRAFMGLLARMGDSLRALGWSSAPVNSARLHALLGTSEFSCEELVRSGFVHPQSADEGLAEMVAWYSLKAH